MTIGDDLRHLAVIIKTIESYNLAKCALEKRVIALSLSFQHYYESSEIDTYKYFFNWRFKTSHICYFIINLQIYITILQNFYTL